MLLSYCFCLFNRGMWNISMCQFALFEWWKMPGTRWRNKLRVQLSKWILWSADANVLNSLLSLHSFIQAISIVPLQVHYYSEALPTQHGDCVYTVSEFHAESLQAIVSEGLAHGPCVVARAWFEPTTPRTKGDESNNEPLCPTKIV